MRLAFRRAVLVLAIGSTATVAACAPPAARSGGASPVFARMDAENARRRSEFESRRIEWTVPASLQTVADRRIRDRLIDPESARFRYDFTTVKERSTSVCGAVNAKNSLGGYTGFKRFFVETVDGRATDSAVLQRNGGSHRLVENCGYTDLEDDESRSTAEKQRPAQADTSEKPPARRPRRS